MISYDSNKQIKVRIFIEFVEANNEWEFVEDTETYVSDLIPTINEYIIAYKRVHYKLHHLKLDANTCSMYLVEF